MNCPECNSKDTDVIDSRSTATFIRRRRMCPARHRFTTYEILGSQYIRTITLKKIARLIDELGR